MPTVYANDLYDIIAVVFGSKKEIFSVINKGYEFESFHLPGRNNPAAE